MTVPPPNIARPSCDTPDSDALGMTWYACASTVMPMNIVIARAAMVTSVADAFFDSGGRNAGTPFDTASTPVIAVQPLAKAVSSRNVVSGAVPVSGGSGACTGTTLRVTYWYSPAMMSTPMLNTKKYVGTAKM